MAKATCFYSIAEDGEGEDATRYPLETTWFTPRPREAQAAAEEAAEDYHNNHDGFEAKWPLTVVFYETEEGPEMSRWLVEMEHVPSFSAFTIQAKGGQ